MSRSVCLGSSCFFTFQLIVFIFLFKLKKISCAYVLIGYILWLFCFPFPTLFLLKSCSFHKCHLFRGVFRYFPNYTSHLFWAPWFFFFLLLFTYFLIGGKLLDSVVWVSAIQQRTSAKIRHVSLPSWASLLYFHGSFNGSDYFLPRCLVHAHLSHQVLGPFCGQVASLVAQW